MIKNFKWLLLVSLTFVACTNNDDETIVVSDSTDGLELTAGDANFSKYVSLGNSLTAGYSDGTLFIKGQEGAYPNILAQRFALVGGGQFTTPFMADNIGGFKIGGTIYQGPRLYLAPGNNPTPVDGPPTTEITTHLTGPFNNMGVPGAKSFHLLAANYGNVAGLPSAANPFFVRFASTPSAKIIEDAMAQTPTFFSLWIGNNDVLSYATSGGTGVNQLGNLNPATYGGNDITDPNVFASVYAALLNTLTSAGAKGVVANIPYVTTVPFFTTVPTNPIPLDATTAAQLNAGLLGPVDAILTAYGQPNRIVPLTASSTNPLLIKDESLTNLGAQITGALIANGVPAPQAGLMGSLYGQARHASNVAGSKDYILLTARGIIGTTQAGIPAPFNKVGVTYPMQDNTTLTASEVTIIKTATDAFNVTIQSLASAKGLAFVDANAILAQINAGGIVSNNYTFLSAYVTGGTFSLDGVHPSPRGQALIANKFLEAINTTYHSNLKGVNVGNYQILYPKVL
jgi:lysophospholipase L1-like esterase